MTTLVNWGGHFLSQIISDVENLADFLQCPIRPLEERKRVITLLTCAKKVYVRQKTIKFAIARVNLETIASIYDRGSTVQ
jgi:hypothetical protein